MPSRWNHKERRQSTGACRCLCPLIRAVGLLTAFVMCGIGVDIYFHGYRMGIFLMLCAAIIFVIEVEWLITIFLELFNSASEDKCCSLARLTGGWHPAPFYIALGSGLLLWPHNLWLSYVAGVMLIFLAILRLGTLIRFSTTEKENGQHSNCDFNRLTNYADIVEDGTFDVDLDDDPVTDYEPGGTMIT